MKNVFNLENAYDKIWQNALGIIYVGNGDVIGFDVTDDNEDKRVIYLSCDDSEGHGMLLGNTFIEFINNLILVGGCGPEDWQMESITNGLHGGILPDSENAKEFRKWINLTWE